MHVLVLIDTVDNMHGDEIKFDRITVTRTVVWRWTFQNKKYARYPLERRFWCFVHSHTHIHTHTHTPIFLFLSLRIYLYVFIYM